MESKLCVRSSRSVAPWVCAYDATVQDGTKLLLGELKVMRSRATRFARGAEVRNDDNLPPICSKLESVVWRRWRGLDAYCVMVFIPRGIKSSVHSRFLPHVWSSKFRRNGNLSRVRVIFQFFIRSSDSFLLHERFCLRTEHSISFHSGDEYLWPS